MLGLAVAAAIGWGLFELAAWRGPGLLARALARAFAGGLVSTHVPAGAALVLVGLLAVLIIACVVIGPRPRARTLGVADTLGEIPTALALLGCVLALVLIAAALRPSVAASARAVDADGLAPLWPLWCGWLRRGFQALIAVALGVGVLERLVSARALWQGLHLTREQARERARASGEGRRRGGRPGSA